MDNNSRKFSSVICGDVFSSLLGIMVGRGIVAGVKKTPVSIISRLTILAMFIDCVYTGDKYAEWCYEVGDMITSSVRKGWDWSRRKYLGKILEDVYEDVRDK